MQQPFNKVPFAVNMAYMLLAGLLLCLAPGFGKQIFQVPDAPIYLARLSGILILGLAGILQHGLRQRDLAVLQGFGIVQIGAALLYAGIVWLDAAPSTFWVIVYANVVLGIWNLLVAREMRADGDALAPAAEAHRAC